MKSCKQLPQRQSLIALLFCFFLIPQNGVAQNYFSWTIWETTVPNESITIPTYPNETYNDDVEWGDGTTDEGLTGNASNVYAVIMKYCIRISRLFLCYWPGHFLHPVPVTIV
ncbi:MAG: hypothetical protein ACJA1A_002120 [Saprospiraceae bacterium]|jgi:hypothetical protein|tara:strand:+ start:549 stop:884 length:336 start_codon:yes stop_codon:yes gene_type:complete